MYTAVNKTHCEKYDNKFHPCSFPYTTRAAAEWNFDDNDGPDAYKCQITYAESTGNLHTLSCVIHFFLSTLAIVGLIILFTNNRAFYLTHKAQSGTPRKKEMNEMCTKSQFRFIQKIMIVYADFKATISAKRGKRIEIFPFNFMQRIYMNMICLAMVLAFGSIDINANAGRLPLVVWDIVYETFYGWGYAIGCVIIYEWGIRIEDTHSKGWDSRFKLTTKKKKQLERNVEEGQETRDSRKIREIERDVSMNVLQECLYVFLRSSGPKKNSYLTVTFYSSLVFFILTGVFNVCVSAPYRFNTAHGLHYFGVYNMQNTCYANYFIGVMQIGYCILAIIFGWVLFKEVHELQQNRNLLKTKQYYIEFTLMMSFFFLGAFLLNMRACVDYSRTKWIYWRSPPCSLYEAIGHQGLDFALLVVYMFLIINGICKATLPKLSTRIMNSFSFKKTNKRQKRDRQKNFFDMELEAKDELESKDEFEAKDELEAAEEKLSDKDSSSNDQSDRPPARELKAVRSSTDNGEISDSGVTDSTENALSD